VHEICGKRDLKGNEMGAKRYKLILLMGPPGAGKGLLTGRSVTEMDVKVFAVGQILRNEIEAKTSLGIRVQQQVAAGQMVADELIDELFSNWYAKQGGETLSLLDGYPRTEQQVQSLLEWLQRTKSMGGAAVFLLEASRQTLIQRLAGRLICSAPDCGKVYGRGDFAATLCLEELRCRACGAPLMKREDDTEEVVQKRLERYFQTEERLLRKMVDNGLPVWRCPTDEQTPEQIFETFKKFVENSKKSLNSNKAVC
jgi:adenylate kinase